MKGTYRVESLVVAVALGTAVGVAPPLVAGTSLTAAAHQHAAPGRQRDRDRLQARVGHRRDTVVAGAFDAPPRAAANVYSRQPLRRFGTLARAAAYVHGLAGRGA